MDSARSCAFPSRNQVLEWQAMQDRVAATIRRTKKAVRDLETEHGALSEKIRESWRIRTPRLNDDVVAAIVNHFRPNFEDIVIEKFRHGTVPCPNHNAALARLCLVSKQWLSSARRVLCHTVHLCNDQQFEKFAANLAFPAPDRISMLAFSAPPCCFLTGSLFPSQSRRQRYRFYG